jgi:hypothetical protein
LLLLLLLPLLPPLLLLLLPLLPPLLLLLLPLLPPLLLLLLLQVLRSVIIVNFLHLSSLAVTPQTSPLPLAKTKQTF